MESASSVKGMFVNNKCYVPKMLQQCGMGRLFVISVRVEGQTLSGNVMFERNFNKYSGG